MRKKIYIFFAIVCVIFFVFGIVFNYKIFPSGYKKYVSRFAEDYKLDTALVYAVIKTESDFKIDAVSVSRAVGLMQILPTTASWIASKLDVEFSEEILFDAKTNIEFGCFYLNYLYEKFGDLNIVICAYNAGETKVKDWIVDGKLEKAKIDYKETRNYLEKVNRYYKIYKNKELLI